MDGEGPSASNTGTDNIAKMYDKYIKEKKEQTFKIETGKYLTPNSNGRKSAIYLIRISPI